MLIRVEVLPWLSELVNGSISKRAVLDETVSEGETLRGLLLHLCEKYDRLGRMVFDPERHEFTGHAEIAVNGAIYERVGGLDAPLHEGDTVAFLPAVTGG